MDRAQVAKEHHLTQWNALCAQHVFPFASHASAQSLDILKQHITHDPNAEVSLPSQHSKYTSLSCDIPLVAALVWHPQLVEHCLNQGAVVPKNSQQWHADLLDVWIFGTKRKTQSEIQILAGDFVRSLLLLRDVGYYFAEYKDPNSKNDRNRRLSFLHAMLWRLDANAYPEVLFSECIKHDIPVSEDFLTDIKCLRNKVPNLCDQVEHYVLSQVAHQSANRALSKRLSKI